MVTGHRFNPASNSEANRHLYVRPHGYPTDNIKFEGEKVQASVVQGYHMFMVWLTRP